MSAITIRRMMSILSSSTKIKFDGKIGAERQTKPDT